MNREMALNIIKKINNTDVDLEDLETKLRLLNKTIPKRSKYKCKTNEEAIIYRFISYFGIITEIDENIFMRTQDTKSICTDYLKYSKELMFKRKTMNRQLDDYKFIIECKEISKNCIDTKIKCFYKKYGKEGDTNPFILDLYIKVTKDLKHPLEYIINKIYSILKERLESPYNQVDNPFQYLIHKLNNIEILEIDNIKSISSINENTVIINNNYSSDTNLNISIKKIQNINEGDMDESYSLLDLIDNREVNTKFNRNGIKRKKEYDTFGYTYFYHNNEFKIIEDNEVLFSILKISPRVLSFILNKDLYELIR